MLERMLKVMAQSAPATTSLYARVLGEQARGLHGQVTELHCAPGSVRATGWMRVDRGSGRFSRLVATLPRLPRPGGRVGVELTIDRHGDDERWVRRFGVGPALRSRQSAGHGGELVERFGVLEFVFTLDVTGGTLGLCQADCQLRLGGLALGIPCGLAPHVEAVVGPAKDRGLAVSVRIDHPWLGRLLAYEGVVHMQEGCR